MTFEEWWKTYHPYGNDETMCRRTWVAAQEAMREKIAKEMSYDLATYIRTIPVE